MVSVKRTFSVSIDGDAVDEFDRKIGKVPRSPAIEGLIRLANRDDGILARALACEPENEKSLRGME